MSELKAFIPPQLTSSAFQGPTLLNPVDFTKRLPKNHESIESDYYYHERRYSTPRTKLLHLGKTFVSPGGLLTTRFKVHPLSYFAEDVYRSLGAAKALRIGLKTRLSPKHRMNAKHVWIVEPVSQQFFHWICDVGQKLAVLANYTGEFGNILLPASYEKIPYVTEMLRFFPELKISYIPLSNRVVEVQDLSVLTPVAHSGNYHPEAIKLLRDRLREMVGDPNRRDRLIYVSRRFAARRRILNENQVERRLNKRGFETVHLERLPMKQQGKLFSEARCIVGLHGAGLSNMLFSQAATEVVEIRQYGDRHNNCFYSLADACQQSYSMALANPETEHQNPRFGDVHVNPDELDALLDKVLG